MVMAICVVLVNFDSHKPSQSDFVACVWSGKKERRAFCHHFAVELSLVFVWTISDLTLGRIALRAEFAVRKFGICL